MSTAEESKGQQTSRGEPASRTFRAIGVTCSVLVTDESAADIAACLLEQDLNRLDDACSRFRTDSELIRLQERAGRPCEVSPLLLDLLIAAQEMAEFTEGAADPTIRSSLIRLGYDRDFHQLDQVRGPSTSRPVPAPGWRSIVIDPERHLVTIPPGTTVDLGASAKAFAADHSAKEIATKLQTGVLVNLGGDLSIAGEPPETGWRIGIALDSSSDPRESEITVALRSGGLASSGTAVRRWLNGREAVHHIIDPSTGYAATSPWVLVSAVANSCLFANAATTAAIVRGNEALAWLERVELPARLVDAEGQVLRMNGWPEDRVRG